MGAQLRCVLSLLTVLINGMAVELGHVGREGMVDISVFLGRETSESRIVVQVPGYGQAHGGQALPKT